MQTVNIRTKTGEETLIKLDITEEDVIKLLEEVQTKPFVQLKDESTKKVYLYATNQIENVQFYPLIESEGIYWQDILAGSPMSGTEVLVYSVDSQSYVLSSTDEEGKWTIPELNGTKLFWMMLTKPI